MACAKAETAYKSVNDESTVTPMKKILKWTGVVLSHPIQASLWAVDQYWRESIWTASYPKLPISLYKTPMPKKKKKKKNFFCWYQAEDASFCFGTLKRGSPSFLPTLISYIGVIAALLLVAIVLIVQFIVVVVVFFVADRILMSRHE